MLKYASDEKAFFDQYRPSFLKLQMLGYDTKKLKKVGACPKDDKTGKTVNDRVRCPALTLQMPASGR